MKLLLKSILFLSVAIIVLLSGLGFWLRTDNGIKTATDFVAHYIEKQTDRNYKITIEKPKFSFPFVLEVEEVTLSDKEEEIIAIQKFCINILPSLLWLQNITIWDISAQQIILSKIPSATPHPEEVEGLNRHPEEVAGRHGDLMGQEIATRLKAPRNDDSIPNIDIQNIAVDKIILSPVITGLEKDISFNVGGNLSFDSRDGVVSFEGKVRVGAGGVLSDSEGSSPKSQGLPYQGEGPLELEPKLKELDPSFHSGSSVNTALLQNTSLDIKAKYNFANNNIKISEFKISAPYSDIEGVLEVNTQENLVIGHARYQSSALEFVLPGQKSLFEGTINLSGSLLTPEVKLEGLGYLEGANGCYFQIPKTTWGADFTIDKNDIKGKVTLNSGAIKANGEIGKNGQQFYLRNFKVQGNNLSSGANLVFDSQSKLITGEFNASSSNINELKAFFPFVQKGSIDIKTKYSGSANTQGVILNSKVKHLSTSFLNCDLADIDLSIINLWELKLDHADIKLKSLIYDKISLRDFTLNAKNNGDFVSFDSYVKSFDPYPFNLKVSGVVRHPEEPQQQNRHPEGGVGRRGDLRGHELATHLKAPRNDVYPIQITSSISGTLGRLQIASPEAVAVKIAKGLNAFAVQAPNIKVNDGKLNINLAFDDVNVKGEMIIASFPAMVFPDLLPEVFAKSLISGALSIHGTEQATIFNSELEIGNIELIKKDPSYATLKLSANLANNELLIDSEIIRENQSLVSFNAWVPYKLLLFPLQAALSKHDPMSATLKIHQAINLLALLPTPPGHKLLGYAGGQMHVSGSFESPVINGFINVDRTEYKYKAYGIKLKDISAKLVAQNSNITISDFVAKDVSSNAVTGAGKLSMLHDVPFTVNLTTDKFNFISTPYLQGEIGGKLTISGNNQKALAKGSFGLGPMEFKIPEHFSDNIPTLNITETLNQNIIIYTTPEKPYILELDIDLLAKQQVYVRGWGVNTLLVGDLKIKNEINDPYIFGRLRSSRGTYQEFGKVLTVKEGVLIFDGPISPSPYLNIVGVTMVDGEEIRLILSGSIFKPDVKIESGGSSSPEEALSKLLFGKNPDSITTMQALALADGMRRISGHGGGFDPMGLGRKILGVDDISIKNNEDTDKTSVGVGKYLTDKIYLEVEQGDDISGAKTRIEVQITSKITLEGITSEKGNSSVGINWRFDY